MSVEQLPDEMREFAHYLRELLARLDRYDGWCLVFWQRDPEAMRACVEGREPPPWDVVESLLYDLAAAHGPGAARAEAPSARSLHTAALAAYDALPGAREVLHGRLDVMLRERRYAAERRAELARRSASATTREEAGALRDDLAWADDDHRRATARCAELTVRIRSLGGHAPRTRTEPPRHEPHRPAPAPTRSGLTPTRSDPTPLRPAPAPSRSAPAPPEPAPARKRRRGGARFAGAEDEEQGGPVVVPPTVVPELPPAGASSRGARFAGAAGEPGERAEPWNEEPGDAADRQEVGHTVMVLARLRGEGRGGEAHALLSEAARSPVGRLPLFAEAMRRAGLGTDWATLLWEAAAALPADRLVAAADALTGAGRAEDGEQILRHGVVRPADEIGRAALTLDAQARHHEALALLGACLRMRAPADAARTAASDPPRLVPLLLTAARDLSDARHRDLLHALRVAGFTT
ncbi:hypothetical protein HTV45_20250 [Streptomyces sp. CHD11]|uniref:hypothetical protein n=1 Tax=Streptomyces sp. CHD11 TaxID=2741325 RepID=UPI001BFC751C|nr:hypothetical protein [Streptomyces sp. CHD11]MBT3153169.1 hypothetical protein [Streptomyces sp. CHD11]